LRRRPTGGRADLVEISATARSVSSLTGLLPAFSSQIPGIETSAPGSRPYRGVLTAYHHSATLAPLDAGRRGAAPSVVIRHAIGPARSRRSGGRRGLAGGHFTGVRRHDAPKNHVLRQLSPVVRKLLLDGAEYITLPVGQAFARVGDPVTNGYFPDDGLLSLISEMTTGHHVAIATVGVEGMLGIGSVLGLTHHLCSPVALVTSHGYLIAAYRLLEVFKDSENLRQVALAYIGGRLTELATIAACHRVHSLRQRLARWLLVATDKVQQQSLPITHDALARIVGGPRHAVTVALQQLRRQGAIVHRRGHIDVLRPSALIQEACECYAPTRSVPL
jgi:CRP-like cAMP-binding protein